MPTCSVFWCKKKSGTSSLQKDNTSFHLFPKEPAIRLAWIQACGNHNTWVPKRTSTICSQHFETSCFILQSNNKRRLKQNAVPSLKVSEIEEPSCKEETSTTNKRKVEGAQQVQTQGCETCIIQSHSAISHKDTNCEAGTSTPKRKKVTEPLLFPSQECETQKVQPRSSEHTSASFIPKLEDTQSKKNLKKRLQMKNKQIKRLQAQKRYLKKKVAGLQEILSTLTEKSLIDKEERLLLDNIGVEERELLNRLV